MELVKAYLRNPFILNNLNRNILSGDFNGDGKDDILIWNPVYGVWRVMLSRENAFINNKVADSSIWLKSWGADSTLVPLIGDFNGDGKDDILLWNKLSGEWKAAISSQDRFIPGKNDGCWLKSWAAGDSWVPLAGDFDGDGRDDIAVWHWVTGDWQVALSTGEEFIPSAGEKCSWLKNWGVGDKWVPFTGDFNGDGMDDIMLWDYATGDWHVALSTGKEFITDIGNRERSWLKNWAIGDKWFPCIGDFNNDGRDDIIVLDRSTGGWQLSVSAGRRFNMHRIESRGYQGGTFNFKDTLVGDFDGDGCDEILLIDKFPDNIGAAIRNISIQKPVLSSIKNEQPLPCNMNTSDEPILSKTRYTIIYPPTVDWNEPIFQRPHQLMAEFARQGHFAVFANTKSDGKGAFWFANDNLCIANNFKSTLSDPAVRKKMEGTKIVLWKTWPDSLTYGSIVEADIVVFDYIDESVDEFSAWKIKLQGCMEIADIIITTSKRLYDITAPSFPENTFLVRNGADIRQFLKEDISLPEDLEMIKRKYRYTIGFVGTLYTWIDYVLIREMAEKKPNWGFVFIGPDYNVSPRLSSLPNIHPMGPRKYNELVNYMKNMDAGIIPFEVRSMTHSVNPIKMYEYLASGLPVVTTPINECQALSPYVRTGSTGKEFVQKLEEAIEASQFEREDYIRIARENSWTARVRDITSILGGFDSKKKVSEAKPVSYEATDHVMEPIRPARKKLSIASSGFLTTDGATLSVGGVQRYTRDLSVLCRDLGYDVTVHQFGNGSWQREFEGIKIKAYPFKGNDSRWYLNARECIENAMKDDLDKADYVIYIWIGFQQSYRPNSISVNHGVWLNIPNSKTYKAEGYVREYIEPALLQLSALVTVDITFLNICRCVIPEAETGKIVYIPNYVDTNLFKPGSRTGGSMIKVLYPRRYDRERGIHIMQGIVPGLLDKYPEVIFNFALGSLSEPCTLEWNKWYNILKYKERVKWCSYSMDEMPAAYDDSDIVVLPSINSEGTSFSAMEAMAAGKAIVAANVGGLSDIILPGVNGKLANPTVEDVRRAVEEYISSPEERNSHGAMASKIAGMAFSKKRWEGQWSALLKSIFRG